MGGPPFHHATHITHTIGMAPNQLWIIAPHPSNPKFPHQLSYKPFQWHAAVARARPREQRHDKTGRRNCRCSHHLDPSVARPSTSTRRTRSKASLGECRPYAHSRRCRRWPVPPKGMSAEQRAPPCAARAKGRSRAHPAVTASITPAKRSAAHNPNGERPAESPNK